MSAKWTDSGTLAAGGKTLEYSCFGPSPENAPTIVLLHEGLGCVALWRDFPSKLADATGFGVLAYSRAGYGHSDPAELPRPLDYMTREAMVALPDVLDATGFRRGILIGHSDGATIAAIHAGTSGDHRVRGTVLMAPHFFTEKNGLDEIRKTGESFETSGLRSRMEKYHRDAVHTFRGWNDAWLDPQFRDWNVADVIDYIRVPVLAIQGEDDQYGTLAQIETLEERAYCPVDKLILNNCGHWPFSERESNVVSAIANFCGDLERLEAAVPEAI